MTRWVDSANATAAAAQSVQMVTFVDLDISGDRLRLHDGIGTINWGGFDWLGLGTYGGVDVVAESLEVIARPVRLTLSGVDPQYVTDAMTALYHQRPVVIYVGLFNINTLALAATPEEVWSGYMDVMDIEFDQNLATIRLDCEHRLRKLPVTSRYTDEEQRTKYAGDLFFNKLHLIPGYKSKWGLNDTSYGRPGLGDNRPGPRRRVQPF